MIFYFDAGSTFRICTEHLKVHSQSGSVPEQVTCPAAGGWGEGGVTDNNNFRASSGVHHQSEGKRGRLRRQ